MKCNIKRQAQYNTAEIIKSTSNEFLFGKDVVKKVREQMNFYDTFFLPDPIITAPLHTDIAKSFMGEFLWRARAGKVKLTDVLHAEMSSIARDFLISSICHALSSRAKNDVFKDYRGINWLEQSNIYRKTAQERYDNLLKSCGGLFVV